jgi:hypothetical protein
VIFSHSAQFIAVLLDGIQHPQVLALLLIFFLTPRGRKMLNLEVPAEGVSRSVFAHLHVQSAGKLLECFYGAWSILLDDIGGDSFE